MTASAHPNAPGTPPAGKTLAADEYAARHDAEAGFESVCLEARAQCNLRWLQALQPASVVEVGCGPLLLAPRWRAVAPGFAGPWVVVEPAARWAQGARQAATGWPALQVVQAYAEEAAPALARALPQGADVVLISGVLHETAAPQALLAAGLQALRPGGALVATVPNAWSFHRLLAVRMGLTDTPEALSERNRQLGQPTVFTPPQLQALTEAAGLRTEALEGYLFKPFTHAQMDLLRPSLGDAGLQGLMDLGRDFPNHAAELCIVARKPG